MRTICVAVVGVVVVSVPATAQPDEAFAFLDHVPEADVAAATGDTSIWKGKAQRRVCLRPSLYLFAMKVTHWQVYRGEVLGTAAGAWIAPESAGDPWEADEAAAEQRVAQIDSLGNPGLEKKGRGWVAFTVPEPTCYVIATAGAAVKLYRVSAFIPWGSE